MRARVERGVVVSHEGAEEFGRRRQQMGGAVAGGEYRVLTLENLSSREEKTLSREREN